MKISVLPALIVMALAAPAAASAESIPVNDTSDATALNPAVSCQTASGTCTLRSAIQRANVLGEDSTITVPAGTYKLTIAPNGNDGDDSGDLNLNNSGHTITINGAGSTIVDANFLDRAFSVVQGTTAVISDVTVKNGRPGGLGANPACRDNNNAATVAPGGGILNQGTLTLTDDVITANTSAGNGGGIEDEGSKLTMTGTTVSSNTACSLTGVGFNVAAFGAGGGLNEASGGPETIGTSTFTGNTAYDDGGGIREFGGGKIDVSQSTISSNKAPSGGGIAAEGFCECSGTVNLDSDTVNGNTATQFGGAVYMNPDTVTVVNSTVTGNTANNDGGGFAGAGSGSATISYSTIDANIANGTPAGARDVSRLHPAAAAPAATQGGNLASIDGGTFTLDDSIVTAGSPQNCGTGPGGNGTTAAHNNLFDDDGTSCSAGATDLTSANPELGSLQNNGGPTQTQALPFGSPAIDAGDAAKCPTTDQRGITRPQGPGCDIGAFEYQRPDIKLAASTEEHSIFVGQQDTVTDTVTNIGPADAPGVSFTDPGRAGFTINSVHTSQGTCTHTATTVHCTLGKVSKGGKVTIRIVLTGRSVGTITLTSKVTQTPAASDPSPADNTATVTIKVAARPKKPVADLALKMDVSPTTAFAPHELTYTSVATNNGPDPATRVFIVEQLPAGATNIDGGASSGGGCINRPSGGHREITCSIGNLAVGHHVTMTIHISEAHPGTYTSSGHVSGQLPDPDLHNNDASASAVLKAPLPAPRILLRKTVDQRQITAGQTATFHMTVTNTDPFALRNVSLCDQLPSSLGYVASNPRATKRRGAWCWTFGSIGPRRSVTVWLRAEALLSTHGTVINRATASVAGARTVRSSAAVVVIASNPCGSSHDAGSRGRSAEGGPVAHVAC